MFRHLTTDSSMHRRKLGRQRADRCRFKRFALEHLEQRAMLAVVAELLDGRLEIFDTRDTVDVVEESNQVTLSIATRGA